MQAHKNILFPIFTNGGAEPCPFSAYSDVNVKTSSLREALHSPLFTAIRDSGLLREDHDGGCTLYKFREQVESLAGADSAGAGEKN